MSDQNNLDLMNYRLEQIEKRLEEEKTERKADRALLQEIKTDLASFKFGAKVTSFIGGVVGAVLFFIADHLWKKP